MSKNEEKQENKKETKQDIFEFLLTEYIQDHSHFLDIDKIEEGLRRRFEEAE